MLGVLFPEKAPNPRICRQQFLPSPTVTGYGDKLAMELEQLFHRLVKITVNFINSQPLPESSEETGDTLSGKAIPYYYHQDGMSPLY
jgi:hypothetical protein